MKKQLTVITQNLNKKPEQKISKYFDEFKADIYAFQELKSKGSRITEIFTCPEFACSCKEIYCGHKDERIISESYFPWLEFRSGYWMEKHIIYGGKEIFVINIHCSPRYSSEQRFILLKRLDQLAGKNVILLGDFNAAFKDQTENNIEENDAYLKIITKEEKYHEMCQQDENIELAYTFIYKFQKKKLDHVFISSSLYSAIDTYQVTYLHSVNENADEYNNESVISTDHSGISVTMSF